MTGHMKNHAGVTKHLENIANGTDAPADILQHAMLAAMSPGSSERCKTTYEALCTHFRSSLIRGPDAALHKLPSLQRNYVRYVLVERFREAGHKGLAAYHMASEYLAADSDISWNTVRDIHSRIKKSMTDPRMRVFCRGLDYEFQIALYGDETPPSGTIVDPDFLRS